MAAFKNPTFDERAAASRAAKLRALEKLRNTSGPTEPTPAGETAAVSPREAAAAERRAAHRAAIEQDKAARAELRAKAQAEEEAAAERAAAARRPAPMPTVPTPSELKAARDARYAARKERKRG